MKTLSWQIAVARIVLDLVRAGNRGRVPRCSAEWSTVCERYGCILVIVHARGASGACLMDNVLVIRAGTTERQTCHRIAHEVTEFLLVSEHAPPYYYVTTTGNPVHDRHVVARLVEHCLPEPYPDAKCPVLPLRPVIYTVGARLVTTICTAPF